MVQGVLESVPTAARHSAALQLLFSVCWQRGGRGGLNPYTNQETKN